MVNNSGYLRHFEACNRHDLHNYVQFCIGGQGYGGVEHNIAGILLDKHADDFVRDGNNLALAPSLQDFEQRSAALAAATATLSTLYNKSVRREMYPLLAAWGDEPLAQLDRIAVPWFGVPAFGVHVNGYVRKPDGLYWWIGERAANRSVDPNMLDNMIGGGQPIGLSIRDNLRKEAMEEAGLSGAVIENAVHARTLRYMMDRQGGLRNDTLFVFDVEMPEGIVPRNTDGEVAAFHLMPAHEVAKLVYNTNRFKFNCNIVIIDFLIRHGIITAEHPEYAALQDFLPTTHTPDVFR